MMYVLKAKGIKRGLPCYIEILPDCKSAMIVNKQEATRFNNIMGVSAVADKFRDITTEIVEVSK